MPEFVTVRDLAARMRAVATAEPASTLPVLLGMGCAEAAGVPSYSTMARQTRERVLASRTGRSATTSSRTPEPPAGQEDDAALVAWFLGYLKSLGPAQRYKVLEPRYRAVPIPPFYRDLADLAVARYVSHVLTLNVDSLLEQAVERAGLRRGTGYEVVVLGSNPPTTMGPERGLRIVKLHGDLGEAQLPIGPLEIEEVLHGQKSAFRPQLLDELIVVGHQLSQGEPVDDWLWRTSGQPLWWAATEAPGSTDPLMSLDDARPVRLLAGADRGAPESLFSRLSFELLRLPALEATDVLDPNNRDEHRLEVAFHRSELLKTRATAYELQEQLVPGVHDDAVAVKLADQQRRSVHQEAQLTAITAEQPAPNARIIAETVDRVLRETDQLAPGQPVVDYLRDQASLILRQAGSKEPDSRVISAALAGVVVLTDALGGELSPDTHERIHQVAALLDSDWTAASYTRVGETP